MNNMQTATAIQNNRWYDLPCGASVLIENQVPSRVSVTETEDSLVDRDDMIREIFKLTAHTVRVRGEWNRGEGDGEAVAALGPAEWLVTQDEDQYLREAWTLAGALDQAVDGVNASGYARETTTWVDVRVTHDITGQSAKETVAVDPDEPECQSHLGHDWQSPHALVGGDPADPGVFGSGGGVKITQVCLHCYCGRLTNTWAQRPDTGAQGLTSVSYEPDQFTPKNK